MGAASAVIVAVALVIAAAAAEADLSAVAGILGVSVGGYIAGRRAGRAGALHGTLVAVAWILLLGLGVLPQPGAASSVVADTALTVLSDVIVLAAGSIGGWLATRG